LRSAAPHQETCVLTETQLPGEAAIAAAELEAVPNPAPYRDYTIDLSYPEFTCKCPRTGYPDFGVINLTYVPASLICELRSFKLYLNRFRDAYIFHEAVTNRILDDFVEAIQPKSAAIVADWNVRGNLKTVVRAEYQAPGALDSIP
jgi:7-cyano-7-deazaguanine reductase